MCADVCEVLSSDIDYDVMHNTILLMIFLNLIS